MSYVIYVATDGKIEGSHNISKSYLRTQKVATDGKIEGSHNLPPLLIAKVMLLPMAK